MKSNYLQKMTEEPVWRIMRNRKYAEQKEKEKTATHTCSIFQYYQLVRKIPYGQTFHGVFSID